MAGKNGKAERAGGVRLVSTGTLAYMRTLSASSNLPKRIRLSLEAFMPTSLPFSGMRALAASRDCRRCCLPEERRVGGVICTSVCGRFVVGKGELHTLRVGGRKHNISPTPRSRLDSRASSSPSFSCHVHVDDATPFAIMCPCTHLRERSPLFAVADLECTH